MTSFSGSLRHCLSHLTTFRGRDTRSQFWFYVLALVITYQALSAVAVVIVLARIHTGAVMDDSPPDPTAFFGTLRLIMELALAVPVLAVGLLAAAITRRLHDSGLRGWWGVMPLPFMIFGMVSMFRLFANFDRPDLSIDQTLFAATFLNNALYLLALLVLVVLLVRGSEPGPNRFGPPPAPPHA